MLEHVRRALQLAAAAAIFVCPAIAGASSHMDAPLITLDDAANTTDVYAFVSSRGGVKYLTTALAVYPHEEPGIGPNKYNFDDDVLYEIRVATGDDLKKGRTTYAYQFPFATTYRNRDHHPAVVLGVIGSVGDARRTDPATTPSTRSTTHPPDHAARARHRPAQQSGQRDAEVQPQQRRRAAARDGVADEHDLDVYTRSRSPTFRTATWASLPAGRRLLCRHPGRLRSPEAARAGEGRGLPGRVQRPHHGAQHSGRRNRRRSADRRRLRDGQPQAGPDSGSDRRRQHTGLRPGRAPGQPALQRRPGRATGQGSLQPELAGVRRHAGPQVRPNRSWRPSSNKLVLGSNVATDDEPGRIAGIFIPT